MQQRCYSSYKERAYANIIDVFSARTNRKYLQGNQQEMEERCAKNALISVYCEEWSRWLSDNANILLIDSECYVALESDLS